MDIQKEREAFLAHMRSIGSASFMFELDDDGNFDDMSMAYAWSAWQAAKAKAVPEGQILVNKGDYVELVRSNRERQKVVARLTEEVKILRERKRYYKNKCKALEFGDD